MRLGVITNRNLTSRWASAHYYIHQALRRHGVEAEHVAADVIAAHHASSAPRMMRRRPRALNFDPFTPEMTEAVLRGIRSGDYDVLLALHASTLVPLVDVDCPLIYVTDATAALLNTYYPMRKGISRDDAKWLLECEERTIDRSDQVLVPTKWAADSVINHYHADPEKVHVVEWGANFDGFPAINETRRTDQAGLVRFLFVGLDWDRKGGDIAVEMVRLLRDGGVNAMLYVVGADVPKTCRKPFVEGFGRLNRAVAAENEQLDQIYRSSDICIHPAKAECYGHVLCEALAYGIPVLSTRTGGISQCVKEGETGMLTSPDASPRDFAELARDMLADQTRFEQMRERAIGDFRDRLNWTRWAGRACEIIEGRYSATGVLGCG